MILEEIVLISPHNLHLKGMKVVNIVLYTERTQLLRPIMVGWLI